MISRFAIVLFVGLVAACGTGADNPPVDGYDIADAPQYPLFDHTLTWTGSDILVVGGAVSAWPLFALPMALAVPLGSYSQPLVIMSVIPFGVVGAILGHFLLGMDLVFFSLLGIVALASGLAQFLHLPAVLLSFFAGVTAATLIGSFHPVFTYSPAI